MSVIKHPLAELQTIAQQVGLSAGTISYCLEVELVQPPLTEDRLAELRRVRRLQELEVNLPGVEIILRMRRRLQALQIELTAMSAEVEATRARFERELGELERRLARELAT